MAFQSLSYPGESDLYLDPKYYLELSEAWNGAGSAPMGLTGIRDDVYAAATLRNRGLGPAFLAQDTAGGQLMTIDDIGTSLTNLFGSGTADITGDTLLRALLEVQGAGTFQDTLHGVGAVTFDDIMDVAGAGTFGDTIDVTGDGTFGANVDIAGDLTVGGAFAVTGAVEIGGTAEFTGLATFLDGIAISAGNLAFAPSGSAQRITGDFSSGTTANRVLLQTSTSNGITDVGAIPNGSGAGAAYSLFSTSNPAASARLIAYAADTAHYLISDHIGASYLPLNVMAGGLVGLKLEANGDVKLGSSTTKKIGLFGGVGAVKQTVDADATDLASAIDLVNSIKAALLAYDAVEE